MTENIKELICNKCKSPRIITSIGQIEKYGGFRQKGFRDLIKMTEKTLRKKEEKGDHEAAESLRVAIEFYKDALERGRVKLVMHCPDHPKVKDKDTFPIVIESDPQPFKDRLLMCGRCGSTVEVTGTRASGDFTVITVRCADHGEEERKVATVFNETLFGAV